jgi:hypothetical protein
MTVQQGIKAGLAAAITIGFFAALGTVMFHEVGPVGEKLLGVMLPTLLTALAMVVQDFFKRDDKAPTPERKDEPKQ